MERWVTPPRGLPHPPGVPHLHVIFTTSFFAFLSLFLKAIGLEKCLKLSGNEFHAIAALCAKELWPSSVLGLSIKILSDFLRS